MYNLVLAMAGSSSIGNPKRVKFRLQETSEFDPVGPVFISSRQAEGMLIKSPRDHIIKPGWKYLLSLDICVLPPEGHVVFFELPESLTTVGLVMELCFHDCSYNEPVLVSIRNTSDVNVSLKKGDVISNMFLCEATLDDFEKRALENKQGISPGDFMKLFRKMRL